MLLTKSQSTDATAKSTFFLIRPEKIITIRSLLSTGVWQCCCSATWCTRSQWRVLPAKARWRAADIREWSGAHKPGVYVLEGGRGGSSRLLCLICGVIFGTDSWDGSWLMFSSVLARLWIDVFTYLHMSGAHKSGVFILKDAGEGRGFLQGCFSWLLCCSWRKLITNHGLGFLFLLYWLVGGVTVLYTQKLGYVLLTYENEVVLTN